MYWDFLIKSAKRNRKENGLYFISLILVFIISYTLLSFDKMEISSFLYQEYFYSIKYSLEDIYIVSVFFLFFLIFLATRAQILDRGKELALLTMMGLKKRKISNMLCLEAIANSLFAILIAFPIAILLNGFINLFTVKLLELGLESHSVIVSFQAFLFSGLILVGLQVVAIKILCFLILSKYPYKLLYGKKKKSYKTRKSKKKKTLFYLGWIFLLISIFLAKIFAYLNLPTIIFFGLGLFFILDGSSYLLDKRAEKSLDSIFDIRLIEEKIYYDKKSFIFSCLIMVASFVLVLTSLLSSLSYKDDISKGPDFTIYDKKENVEKIYKEKIYNNLLEEPIPIYMTDLLDIDMYERLEIHLTKDDIEDILSVNNLLSQSSYNKILKKNSQKPLDLKDDQALYVTDIFVIKKYLDDSVEKNMEYKGENFKLFIAENYLDIFSNKEVFDQEYVVVNDETYKRLTGDKKEAFAYNFYIRPEYKNKLGSIAASDTIRDMMIEDDIKYESKIWQIKRNVYMIVDDLYRNIYLALILFVIVNSYLAFRFIYRIKESKDKFVLVIRMGMDAERLFASIKKTINIYFCLLIIISLIVSSTFIYGENYSKEIFYIYLGLTIFELLYMTFVKKMTKKEFYKVVESEKNSYS